MQKKNTAKTNKTIDKSEYLDEKSTHSLGRKKSNPSMNQLTVLKKIKLHQSNLNLLLDKKQKQSLISLKLPTPSIHKSNYTSFKTKIMNF